MKSKKQDRKDVRRVFEASGRGGDGGEFLVILEPAAAEEALEHLRSGHQVTQIGSPRVVVAVSPGEAPPSPSIPGVVAVSGGAMPPDIGEELDEREALFVAAWVSRMKGPEKQRRGEGLPWDAPGFEPPDPPAGVSPPGD
jgi:hypothetical protein